MNVKYHINIFLFLAILSISSFAEYSLAQATGAPTPQPAFGEVLFRMLPMFGIVFMIYYFMIVKPQQLKAKSQAELTSSLKKGDTVITSGGIFGRVGAIETDGIFIEVAPNVRIKIEQQHVIRKVEPNNSANSAAAGATVSRVK